MSTMSIPVTPPPAASPTTSTKHDSRVVAARELYTVSYRLLNAASILKDCVSIISDPNSSGSKISQHLKYISNLIIPTVELSAGTIDRHGKYISDIPGLKLQIKRGEKSLTKEVVKDNKRKNEHTQLLKHFITPYSPVSTNNPPKRRRLTRGRTDSDAEVEIPEPANGTQYTKFKMLNILQDTDSGKRKKAIQLMIKLNYVPVKKAAI